MIHVRIGFKQHSAVLGFQAKIFEVRMNPLGRKTFYCDTSGLPVVLQDIDADEIAWVTTEEFDENQEPF